MNDSDVTLIQQQPASHGVKLFPHQSSAIEKMRKLETEDLETDASTIVSTSLGLYTDKVGSGKSYAIIQHLLTTPVLKTNPERHRFLTMNKRSLCNDRVFESSDMLKGTRRRVLPTNLLLVPPSTFAQWVSYASRLLPSFIDEQEPTQSGCRASCDFSSNKYIQAAKRITSSGWARLLTSPTPPRILIVNPTAYTQILEFNEIAADAVFQRLVIDEADSIYVKYFDFVDALFLWLVTATPQTLSTSACRCFPIRSMFFDSGRGTWDSERMRFVRTHLQVRHEEEMIDAAIQLPPPRTRTARAMRSYLFRNIQNYLNPLALNALEACDHQRAMEALGCSSVDGDEGIIAALVNKLEREIQDISARLRNQEESENANDWSECDELARRISKRRVTIRNIMDRVRETDCCPIGLDVIEHKAVTPCCQNAFELSNIVRALTRSPACPLCKRVIRPSDLVVSLASNARRQQLSAAPPIYCTKDDALRHELRSVLQEWPRTDVRILLFSCYSTRIAKGILNEIGVPFYTTDYDDKMIPLHVMDHFRSGRLRVLLLNAHNVGAGVNIECATHVFTMHDMRADLYAQVIGRAHRLGRDRPLEIVNVRFEDEN